MGDYHLNGLRIGKRGAALVGGPKARSLETIPVGHYHMVMERGHPVRRAWHLLKFMRVLDCLPMVSGQSILDIGCFAGSFLSLISEERFARQVGVDVLPEQIDFANANFGTSYREFLHVPHVNAISRIEGKFDCITLIEVIEHLRHEEIRVVFEEAERKLLPGGLLVVSTPNYSSVWPIIEIALNCVSDVTYDEQHITKFSYFDVERKLRRIYPALLERFDLTIKTTTHLLTPFLAVFGVNWAMSVARAIRYQAWKIPFGNLVLLTFRKKQ